jgi:phenylacetate-CoA ligase
LDGEDQTVFDRLVGLDRVSVLRPAVEVAERVAESRPDYLYGLPSALSEVASELAAGGRDLCLKGVFTSGELLSPTARYRLRSAYGCRVQDVYGTSETKEIAWECRGGSMHVNSDMVWVEILDEQGGDVPAGHEGEIVVTLLVNKAMPLIRYRTAFRQWVSSPVGKPTYCS